MTCWGKGRRAGKPGNISRLEMSSNSQLSLGAGQQAQLWWGPSCVSPCYRLGFDLPEFVPLAAAPASDPLRAVHSWAAASKTSRLAVCMVDPAHQVGQIDGFQRKSDLVMAHGPIPT